MERQIFDSGTPFAGFLADTWWYGLTNRLSEKQFEKLARLRVQQGFSAVQLVVGIPPEVGPEHPSAAGHAGPAWTLAGTFNQNYLAYARQKIRQLNELGLGVIVYGAWGHQIVWLGQQKMVDWWRHIISHLDDCNVIYCLAGESNLWIGRENMLLPNLSTADLKGPHPPTWLPGRMRALGYKLIGRIKSWRREPSARLKNERAAAWSAMLDDVHTMTNRPIIIHTNDLETGFEVVHHPQLLAANTTQTGHSQKSKNKLWQMPLAHQSQSDPRPFINLEPWYEGIRDDFYVADQLFAYWTSMLAGCAGYCYGAHGIWNVGDGRFLAHWGKQTFEQAMALKTPYLLDLSHQRYRSMPRLNTVSYELDGADLLWICRFAGDQHITYIPDLGRVSNPPGGRIWLPLAGDHTGALPEAGQVVIYSI